MITLSQVLRTPDTAGKFGPSGAGSGYGEGQASLVGLAVRPKSARPLRPVRRRALHVLAGMAGRQAMSFPMITPTVHVPSSAKYEGTDPDKLRCRDLARETGWHVWRGCPGIYYAWLEDSSPQVLASSRDFDTLAAEVRERIRTRKLYDPL